MIEDIKFDDIVRRNGHALDLKPVVDKINEIIYVLNRLHKIQQMDRQVDG